MRELIQELLSALEQNRAVAYCRLVETRGSTPQKAGAAMLVYADGGQAGTLGGGCVEAEVKRRAMGALASGERQVHQFQLDHDYGWDDGLICGGRMQAAVLPLAPGDPLDYFHRLAGIAQEGRGCTEVIVFDEERAGLPAPTCWLFDDHDQCIASLPGDQSEPPAAVREHFRPLKERPLPYAAAGVAFLPLLSRCRLLIVGGGHVGQAVAQLAGTLDFDVWVVDDREAVVSQERFPTAARRIAGPIEQVLPEVDITPDTYCLIVTRGHNHDERALFYLAERGACYVGLIGSRRKIRMIYEDLLAEGISAEALQRVSAPVGIDIGSRTVPEIAVSIAAELIAHRNLAGRIPGRPDSVPVNA
ncbi:XdhC family protein [Lignipirellula cremea]|uniref:Putative xanthine dehydrogenase subunit A n=1 Tax=Lignipirellula cremea TaxID=2528010 RepID=A0A518E1E8_9BACT|nr:XdhC/CoxI family protein [Lignipirellula cremea]QDU97894.1 putative xanthine dehydrogenase subunit A [Lignipirellula cremea]